VLPFDPVEDLAVIDDRFVVAGLFRAGSMGALYRAVHRQTGEPVAVKVLHARNPRLEERFAREARLLAGLDHPHIVRHVAHGLTASGLPYLVTEWLDGETLAARLRRGRLCPSESVRLAARVADALATAHACRVIHRDVKPSNLLLIDGDLEQVKLIDFGIARGADATPALTDSGGPLGTPYYMAPEQVRGVRDLDGRADLFGLGCVLYESLTGCRAFDGDSELEVWMKILLTEPPSLRGAAGLPDPLAAFVARLCAREPAARPACARDVAARLGELGSVEHDCDARAADPGSSHASTRQVLAEWSEEKTDPLYSSALRSGPPTAFLVVALLGADGCDRSGAVDELARFHGGRADLIANTAVLIHLKPDSTGPAAAVSCARALRRLLPGAVVAMTGGAPAGSSSVDGYMIMRAARAVEAAVLDATSVDGVVLDPATAQQLGGSFALQPATAGTHCLLSSAE